MTDTFSYLLFPKLFCPKKLSLVAKNPYRPFFHVWDWSILPLLENELYKRVFNVPFTSGHSTQYFDLSEKNDRMSYHVTYWKAFMCTKFRFGSILFAKAILKKPFLFGKIRSKDKKTNYNSIKTAQQKRLLTSRLSCLGRKRSVMHSFGLQLQPWQLYIMISTIMFFSKLTKPEVQNSCQKYYKGVVGQRRGNNRLQNSPYFCVFKYALAVKQKERVTDFFTVLKKNRLFCSLWQ